MSRSALPQTITPRLLTEAQAAEYCAKGRRAFRAWIERGGLPGVVPLGGRRRTYDRNEIDAALDRLSRPEGDREELARVERLLGI